MNAHRLAELRSLAAHRVLAERLLSDEQVVERAKQRLARWAQHGSVHPEYLQRWQAWLALTPGELAQYITEDTEAARAMRQNSPFAGELEPRLRWKIWRDVKQTLATEPSSNADETP